MSILRNRFKYLSFIDSSKDPYENFTCLSHVIISHVNLEPRNVTCDFDFTCESHVETSHVRVPNSHVSHLVISHVSHM